VTALGEFDVVVLEPPQAASVSAVIPTSDNAMTPMAVDHRRSISILMTLPSRSTADLGSLACKR
jgi:hypothetical protein